MNRFLGLLRPKKLKATKNKNNCYNRPLCWHESRSINPVLVLSLFLLSTKVRQELSYSIDHLLVKTLVNTYRGFYRYFIKIVHGDIKQCL